jgi:hypothetical protein
MATHVGPHSSLLWPFISAPSVISRYITHIACPFPKMPFYRWRLHLQIILPFFLAIFIIFLSDVAAENQQNREAGKLAKILRIGNGLDDGQEGHQLLILFGGGGGQQKELTDGGLF